MKGPSAQQALVVLVGITADGEKRVAVSRFFTAQSAYDVYVPAMPRRRGAIAGADWLHKYLVGTVEPEGYQAMHVLAYISGGLVLRCLSSRISIPGLARVVYVRGPIQEQAVNALIERYGRVFLGITRGRLFLDVGDLHMSFFPFPESSAEQGLIIETGVSKLAASLGISAEEVPPAHWQPGRLLPCAGDVVRVRESHDEVYTSPNLLSVALSFFQHGSFGAPEEGDGRVGSAQTNNGGRTKS